MFLFGDFNRHVRKCADGFEGVHGGNGISKTFAEGRRLLEFCDEKELCVANTWFYNTNKRKITYNAGECETEIDFVLMRRKIQKVYKGCKSDSMGTSAQAGRCRSG